jgi:glycosyltransferase involved in cell wall biosynthesis
MKIAIAGTRGIPNNYGGFEQCAEFLSVLLVKKGHEVTVYNTHYHDFREDTFSGVHLQRRFNPEQTIGTPGNFIYDFLCMRHAFRHQFDILLVLGYTTASVFYPFMNFRNSELITNMDGLEWKRDKWNNLVKKLAKWFERLGARYSPHLVADNEKIREYLWNTYERSSTFIPYGCEVFKQPDEKVLTRYGLRAGRYSILIARMEAENNIEMILDGYAASGEPGRLIVVGSVVTPYGKKLLERYSRHPLIEFKGGIYDLNDLNNLRYFSKYYFHGHSVGGTNPSLLEAMASGAFIVAHDNEFNRAILDKDALYFSDVMSLKKILDHPPFEEIRIKSAIKNNIEKVVQVYNWDRIAEQYESLFNQVLSVREQAVNIADT